MHAAACQTQGAGGGGGAVTTAAAVVEVRVEEAGIAPRVASQSECVSWSRGAQHGGPAPHSSVLSCAYTSGGGSGATACGGDTVELSSVIVHVTCMYQACTTHAPCPSQVHATLTCAI